MIRKVLGPVAAVAIVIGMTVVTPVAVAKADQSDSFCAFLEDGSGTGSAASLPPNVTPTAGMAFQQVNVGAWQLCYDPDSNGELTLKADGQGTWCMADDNGIAKLRSCNGNQDQRWLGVPENFLTSFQARNLNGGYLCATGGVGFVDAVDPLSDCSSYHSTWEWTRSP